MADPVTWTAVAMAAVANMGTWLVIIKGRRSNSKNGNPKLPCEVHTVKIAKLEATEQIREKWLDEFKRTNSLEHQQLSEKLDKLNGKS